MSTNVNVHNEMIGKTFIAVNISYYREVMQFVDSDGEMYTFYPICDSNVSIEDITGELTDLIGSPMLMAEYVENETDTSSGNEKWTFYKFATLKGYVTIRWYGSSNGWYSTSVQYDVNQWMGNIFNELYYLPKPQHQDMTITFTRDGVWNITTQGITYTFEHMDDDEKLLECLRNLLDTVVVIGHLNWTHKHFTKLLTYEDLPDDTKIVQYCEYPTVTTLKQLKEKGYENVKQLYQ